MYIIRRHSFFFILVHRMLHQSAVIVVRNMRHIAKFYETTIDQLMGFHCIPLRIPGVQKSIAGSSSSSEPVKNIVWMSKCHFHLDMRTNQPNAKNPAACATTAAYCPYYRASTPAQATTKHIMSFEIQSGPIFIFSLVQALP